MRRFRRFIYNKFFKKESRELYWSALTRPELSRQDIRYNLREGFNYSMFVNAEGFPALDVWCLSIDHDTVNGGFLVGFIHSEALDLTNIVRVHTKDYNDSWFIVRTGSSEDLSDKELDDLRSYLKNEEDE